MFSNVVVGVDEQGSWRDALALAKQLTREDGRLTLAHVYIFRADPRLRRGYTTEDEAAEKHRAEKLLESALSEAGIEAHLRSRGSTSVGRGLHELVEHLGADLLVVGSSPQGLLGRVLLRDDVHAALSGAPCAIGIAPAGYEQHPPIRKVGVGYDGSPESEVALASARKLAAALDATLSGLEVVSLPFWLLIGPVTTDGATIEEVVNAARERVASLRDIQPNAAYGHPAEELALYSRSVDLLVVGSRGYGPVGRLVHGSIAQKLARTARCALLVLPRGADRAAAPEAGDRDADESPVAATVK